MAYIEVRKGGRLVKRRLVDNTRAEKGCRIRVGSAGQVHLRKGESKTVGPYEIEMLEGVPPEDGHEAARQLEAKSDSLPPMSGTEQTEFTDPNQTRSMDMKSSFPAIDDYEVTGRLGQGGMGTVWRAVQLSTKREVALKFLGKHRFASKRSRARFEREVSLAAKLTHPNIACVYDSGLHRGVYYYAMELVEGIHLDKYVRQNELTQQEILALMKDVCDAVGYAHDKGIIHRDLKPSNILVAKDGRPHVVDFGLAKASMDEDDLTISVDGEITGTLAYMSPEQAAGRLNKIGEPTDVYSLGVILHQLLTGHFPHDVSGSRYDVVKRIVEEDVQSPRTYDDSVDSDLESLILTALAQEPEDRYPSAVVLMQDIENYLNREPLLARSMSATYRIRKHVRKHARPIAKSFLFIAIVVASITITYYLVRSGIPALGPSEQDMAEEVSGLENQQQRPSAGTNYVINKGEVMNAVHRYQDGWKRANLFGVGDLEDVISDKAFAMAGPDQGNPSVAGVWDKAAAIKLAMSMPDDPAVHYGVNFIDIFGPMAYVEGKCTRDKEDGTRHRVETVYYLAKDETGWKFISAGEASYIRKSLRMEPSSTQGMAEHESDRAAIRTLMDRINNSWINKTGSTVMQEILSNKAFAFALPNPDNPSEAVIVDKQAYCEFYDKMQQDRELQKQEHVIKAISVFGPLAFEVGDTCNTYRDGRKEYHRPLNFFAKDETGWKMYFSTSADRVNQALNKELSDEEKIMKMAQEYVNEFRLDEPFPVGRINNICSDDLVVIISDGETIVGKEDYVKWFSQNIESLQSMFSTLKLKVDINAVYISGNIGKIEGGIVWNGQLSDGAKSFNAYVPVSLTFNKTNGKWLLVREEQKKSERDIPEVSDVIQDSEYQSWMPRRESAPAAIKAKGEPFFLICVKGAKPRDFSEYKQAGFNAVLLSDSNSIGFSEAGKHGLHVISQLTFDKANPPDLDQIKHRLAQDAKQSSLLCWTSASLWPVHS